jgi:uncharacterized membrane protein
VPYNSPVWQLLVQFFVACVLVFGVVGFAVGVGLLVSSSKTIAFFHAMNRWVSTRNVLKPMAVLRDTEQIAHKYRRWVGSAFIAGGAYSIIGLAGWFDAAAISAMLAKGAAIPLAATAAQGVRWILIVGSLFGVAIGIMLCFYPNALGTFEKFFNRWISSRQFVHGRDDMNLTLDNLIEAHPRPSGWILSCVMLGVAAYSAIVLFAR